MGGFDRCFELSQAFSDRVMIQCQKIWLLFCIMEDGEILNFGFSGFILKTPNAPFLLNQFWQSVAFPYYLLVIKCGLVTIIANRAWQTNIGGIRQIKLAPGWKEDSTAKTSSYLEMSSPVRHEAASAPDRQEGLIYCGTRRRGQPQASNAAASQLYPLDP